MSAHEEAPSVEKKPAVIVPELTRETIPAAMRRFPSRPGNGETEEVWNARRCGLIEAALVHGFVPGRIVKVAHDKFGWTARIVAVLYGREFQCLVGGTFAAAGQVPMVGSAALLTRGFHEEDLNAAEIQRHIPISDAFVADIP